MDITKMNVRQAVIGVIVMVTAFIFWFIAPLTGRQFEELPVILILIFIIGLVTLVGATRINGPVSMQKEEKK